MREAEALRLLRGWRPYKEAAHEMGVSPNTFRTFVRRGFRKLGIHNRGELLRRRR